MARGYYSGYFWGILQTEEIAALLRSDEQLKGLMARLNIEKEYQSKVPWLGVLVADDKEITYERSLLPHRMPDRREQLTLTSYSINYSVFAAEDTESHLRNLASFQFLDAEQKWTEFATEFERITQIPLPKAYLFVVHEHEF